MLGNPQPLSRTPAPDFPLRLGQAIPIESPPRPANRNTLRRFFRLRSAFLLRFSAPLTGLLLNPLQSIRKDRKPFALPDGPPFFAEDIGVISGLIGLLHRGQICDIDKGTARRCRPDFHVRRGAVSHSPPSSPPDSRTWPVVGGVMRPARIRRIWSSSRGGRLATETVRMVQSREPGRDGAVGAPRRSAPGPPVSSMAHFEPRISQR